MGILRSALSKLGQMRDIGDPGDPRLRYGEVPQTSNAPGLPPATDREIMRRVGDKVVYFAPSSDVSIEAFPRGGRYDALELLRADREKEINAEIARETLRNAVANARPDTAYSALDRAAAALSGRASGGSTEQVLSAQMGRPVSREVANRAQQLFMALEASDQKLDLGTVVALVEQDMAREAQQGRRVSGARGIDAALLREIEAGGEVRPDLAAKNAIQAAISEGLEGDTAVEALARELSPYARAEAAVDSVVGDPYRTLGPDENADESTVLGRNRSIPGTGRRNPFNKEQKERLVDAGYEVPLLVAPATQPKYAKTESGFEKVLDAQGNPVLQPARLEADLNPDRGYREKRWDTRKARVALVNPQAELDPALGYVRFADPSTNDDERSGMGMNAPVPERDATGAVPGFRAGDDPAATKVSVPMTLAQAVEAIAMEYRTPIKTYRLGIDAFVDDEGGWRNSQGMPIYPLAKQKPEFEQAGLADFRIGSRTEITDEGLQAFQNLVEALPGMENMRLLVNERMNDPVTNQAQNALLGMAMSDEFVPQDPRKKSVHEVMRAIRAGSGLEPAERDLEAASVLPRTDGNDYSEAVNPILRASGVNPEVQTLRDKYRAIAGGPEIRNFPKYAAALGAPVGSPEHDAAMRVQQKRLGAIAAEQASSNVPQSAVVNDQSSMLNAPPAQSDQATAAADMANEMLLRKKADILDILRKGS
jgi:hypothetical protein